LAFTRSHAQGLLGRSLAEGLHFGTENYSLRRLSRRIFAYPFFRRPRRTRVRFVLL